jgi:hypothetical protein
MAAAGVQRCHKCLKILALPRGLGKPSKYSLLPRLGTRNLFKPFQCLTGVIVPSMVRWKPHPRIKPTSGSLPILPCPVTSTS